MTSVIYIEDEAIEAMLFQMNMKKRGFAVLHIEEASPEALSALEQDDYKAAVAIFVDQWIGGVSGSELAKSLRDKGEKRPLFLLTAGENPNPELLRSIQVRYVQKAPDFNRLAAQLKEMTAPPASTEQTPGNLDRSG